jgi:hypothetical protein
VLLSNGPPAPRARLAPSPSAHEPAALVRLRGSGSTCRLSDLYRSVFCSAIDLFWCLPRAYSAAARERQREDLAAAAAASTTGASSCDFEQASPRSPSYDDFDPAASARQILSELRPPPTRSACLARSLAAQSECPSVTALRRRRSRRGQRPQSLHALTSRPADHTTRPDSAKVGRSPLRGAPGVTHRRQIGS